MVVHKEPVSVRRKAGSAADRITLCRPPKDAPFFAYFSLEDEEK